MGQRVVRVNELLKREISQVMHTRYRSESVAITITEVRTAPNLRKAEVFFSVVGGAVARVEAERFFARQHTEIQQAVARTVVLKYTPHLQFIFDPSVERGDGLNRLLDELGFQGEAVIEPPATEEERDF